MTYSLNPELKQAIARLPVPERQVVRALLHIRLSRLSKTDNEICRLFNNYDCGRELINHITGGRLQRLEARMKIEEQAVAEITEPLLKQEGTST